MLTEAEKTKIERDNAEANIEEFILDDFQGTPYEEVMATAIDYALDQFDGEQESDGTWIDSTNYAYCAEQAMEDYYNKMKDEHDMRGDYLRDCRKDSWND